MIQALLDGELEGSEEVTLRAHLEECPQCRTGVRSQEGAVKLAAQALTLLDVEPRPHEARARLDARVRLDRRSSQRSFWTLPRAASMASFSPEARLRLSRGPRSGVGSWAGGEP